MHGSGTIFFAYCNVHCIFCQNYDISQHGLGREISTDDLARMMTHLQNRGCHNINLVTPTPWVPQIVKALSRAQDAGLSVPVVYNCGGYESVEVLKLLDGIIDIYMPDMKYGDDEHAEKYSGTPRYWDAVTAALREMHRQAGELIVKEAVASRGVLVRHLVLPHNIAGSERCFKFIARELTRKTVVNVMAQYYPTYRAAECPELNRRITLREYHDAVSALRRYGLDTAARLLEHHE
jgi:putative pyruvate formate lyase activating enzyme